MDAFCSSPPEDPRRDELVAIVRELFDKHPLLAYQGVGTVRRALLTLRGLRVSEFGVEAALEALQVEGEVLA